MNAGESSNPTNPSDGSELTAGNGAEQSGAKEKKVESTRAGKNPNAQATEKPVGNGPAKQPKKAPESAGGLAELQKYLADTWVEFRRISWPTRQQVIQETWSVIVLVTAFTCCVLAFDWAVAKVVFEPLDKFAKQVGGGVGHSTQSWNPLNNPPLPVNQPGAPGSQPMTPKSSPEGTLNPGNVPGNQPAPASGAQPAAPAAPATGNQPAAPAAPAQQSGNPPAGQPAGK